jgi:hypothetical protein
MSNIAISGASTGTATFTLESPATSTNRTLTLPDNTGTIVTTGTTTGISASAISTGTLAAARLPAGTVLQVVAGNTSTSVDNSSTTFADTGLSVTITPSSATSKVLVLVNHSAVVKFGGTSGGPYMRLRLLRNSSEILIFEKQILFNASTQEANAASSASYLDSPATTSAVTYKTQFANAGAIVNGGTVRVQTDSSTATIVAMEIAA